MSCGYCAHDTEVYRMVTVDGIKQTVEECRHCCRRLIPRHDPTTGVVVGWRWNKLGGYCPDCKAETWRIVRHGRTNQPIALWPRPETLTAHHWTRSGWALHGTFCVACCPDFGAPPCGHILEADPEAGGAIGFERSRDRYTRWYSEDYGVWLRAWLVDELRLDEPDRERLVALWEFDRAA